MRRCESNVVAFAESEGKPKHTLINIIIGATITVLFLTLLVIIVFLLLKILRKTPLRQEGTYAECIILFLLTSTSCDSIAGISYTASIKRAI